MRERFPHFERQVVRWSDMDALGHVNNAVYFTYCESARMSFFARVIDDAAEGVGPALATASLAFKRQVRYPATLDVGLRVARIGTSSFTLEYALLLADAAEDAALVAEGESVVVWTDYAAGRSTPLPDALREALSAYA